MHFNNVLLYSMGVFTLLFTACSTQQYFTVDSASYQPAVFNESSRTTTIEVLVSNVDTNVVFTALVFQNLRIPVYAEEIPGNRVKITAYIQIGGKLAEDQYQKLTEEPNKLYYMVEKSQKSIPLENVERQKTQLP